VAAYSNKIMTAAFQMGRQLAKLAWKILMHQQQLHLAS
tara:strand:+ start:64 stop:177 length:114 start_codon:yes stop_codon:yes gene_type:complete